MANAALLAALLGVSSLPAARAATLVEPWGPNSVRVRITADGNAIDTALPTALLPAPVARAAGAEAAAPATGPGAADSSIGSSSSIASSNIVVEPVPGQPGLRRFVRGSDGKVLLEEIAVSFESTGMPTRGGGVTFRARIPGAPHLYGLGMQRETCYPSGGRQTPELGLVVAPGVPHQTVVFNLAAGEGGAANTLPWLLAATPGVGADVGFFLNVPSMGNVTFTTGAADPSGSIEIEWVLFEVNQLDYLVTTIPAAAAPADRSFALLESFTGWVGRSPGLPDWALGYWHSKNRYANQSQLLAAAHGFADRDIPVDIIIIDWMHWKTQGDWHFDPEYWPDPSAMVKEIASLNMSVMVTVWPFSFNGSLSYDTLKRHRWLTASIATPDEPVYLPDALHGGLVDVTQKAAREYVWSMVEDGYYKHGIKVFWLDAAEPEYFEMPAWGKTAWKDATWDAGTVGAMGQMFTDYWVQTFYDGLRSKGETSSIMLPRASYAGTSKYGAGLWSGDIWCTFDVLRGQVRAGVSAQTSGFGLWTSDVGGYTAPPNGNCDATNSSYRELVTRWFQFGACCPIFRQHGYRETEVWKFGPEAEAAITTMIKWRASIKPYLHGEMRKLNITGRPINRPLWWDFPEDRTTWGIDDEFMFGDAYLVAPVLTAGATERSVYLPMGVSWTHHFTERVYAGGSSYSIPTPLATFPLFHRGVVVG